MKARSIPPATVARLPIYVLGLRGLASEGVRLISSQELADLIGLEAAQIRRDLSCLGAFGTPGVGYDVRGLLHEISNCLGLSHTWPVAVVGCGRIGSALAAYSGFPERNLRIVAIFDCDEQKVGTRVGCLEILPLSHLPDRVKELKIDIAILATPAGSAQEVADALVAAGVSSILNLAPVTLLVPAWVIVRNVDLAAELQILAFHQTMKPKLGVCHPVRSVVQRQVTRWLKEVRDAT